MNSRIELPSDEQVRALFRAANHALSEPGYKPSLNSCAIAEWLESGKKPTPIKRWWIENGALDYVLMFLREATSGLERYDPKKIPKRIEGIFSFSNKVDRFVDSYNSLFLEYFGDQEKIGTPYKVQPNHYIYSLIASPFPKPPGAWNGGAPPLRSADSEIQKTFDDIDERSRQWEKSVDGVEWKRHWDEFHDDMQRVLNNDIADAIERIKKKALDARAKAENEIVDAAPKALWRFEFACSICWLWRNLYGTLPGSNPDHIFVGFMEAAWQTVVECANFSVFEFDITGLNGQNHDLFQSWRRLLQKNDLDRWSHLNWERPIRAAIKHLKS